jgi:Transposase DDE domain
MNDCLRPAPAKFKTTNWRRYNQAMKARGALMIWLDRDLQWSGLASSKRGRPSLFSDAAIQFCLTSKALFDLSLRQAMGMFKRPLKLASLSSQVVETKMRCVMLKGERVMARDFERQVAKLRVRAAILNRFTQLGPPETVRMG